MPADSVPSFSGDSHCLEKQLMHVRGKTEFHCSQKKHARRVVRVFLYIIFLSQFCHEGHAPTF